MTTAGKTYVYVFFVCLYTLTLLSQRSMANDEEHEVKRTQKRSVAYADWKRAGQAGYLSELESALGTMQRPRFGKRGGDYPIDEYVIVSDKRGNSMVDLGTALGTIQRPRFGRRR